MVELVRDDCDDWEEGRDNDKDDVELREDGHLFDNIRQGRERGYIALIKMHRLWENTMRRVNQNG